MSLSGKDKLDTLEILISKDLVYSYISHTEFVSVNNVLKKYEYMKNAIKNPKTFNSVN